MADIWNLGFETTLGERKAKNKNIRWAGRAGRGGDLIESIEGFIPPFSNLPLPCDGCSLRWHCQGGAAQWPKGQVAGSQGLLLSPGPRRSLITV